MADETIKSPLATDRKYSEVDLDAGYQVERQFQTAIVVDRYNLITDLSSSWDDVAAEGHAEKALARHKVIGKELDAFIASDSTRMYIDSCLKLCRIKKQVLFRPYRCDSPTHKRYMELQLTPLADGAVEMKHFLLKEEPFPHPVNVNDVSADMNRVNFQFTRCSMCNRLKKVGTEKWVAPEKLIPQQQAPVNVIHSVCPDCLNKLWQKRKTPL